MNLTQLVRRCSCREKDTGLIVEDALLPQPQGDLAHLVIANLSIFTRDASAGMVLRVAEPVEVVDPSEDESHVSATNHATVMKNPGGSDCWNCSDWMMYLLQK